MDGTGRGYENVLSIGSQCLTSAQLRTVGLRRFSGPFDWIFSNLRMVCDCIQDDFAALLDPGLLKAIPAEDGREPGRGSAQHILFKHRYGLDTIFAHYDPTTADGYAYLQRCVARFRSALTSGQPQLLLAVCRPDQGGRYAFERLVKLCEPLPAVDVQVLIVRERSPKRGLTTWQACGADRLAELLIASDMAGLEFTDEDDTAYLRRHLLSLRPGAGQDAGQASRPASGSGGLPA